MYEYKRELEKLGPDAHKPLIKVALEAERICKIAGMVRMDKLMSATGVSDNWGQLAVVERLVELGVLREIRSAEPAATQFRMFGYVGV